jgi:uncharacterized protein
MNIAMHPVHQCTPSLQQVRDIIVKAIEPEYLYLLGSISGSHHASHVFLPATTGYAYPVQYDLLLVLPPGDQRGIDEIQDMVDARCRPSVVSCIVFSICQFNELLLAGHTFCCKAASSGKLIYAAGNTPLAAPGLTDASAILLQAQQAFAKWHGIAEEFLAGATLFCSRRQYKMAAFMLHQAAERNYVALLLVMTGYRAGTHNLDKLARYVRSFSPELHHIFPRDNEKEERLFRLLQKAYIHTRYKDDYEITEKELKVIMERVNRLSAIVSRICQLKIEELVKNRGLQAELMFIGKAV